MKHPKEVKSRKEIENMIAGTEAEIREIQQAHDKMIVEVQKAAIQNQTAVHVKEGMIAGWKLLLTPQKKPKEEEKT